MHIYSISITHTLHSTTQPLLPFPSKPMRSKNHLCQLNHLCPLNHTSPSPENPCAPKTSLPQPKQFIN